jgi:cytochrome bd ubiquinol oxidase subunit II
MLANIPMIFILVGLAAYIVLAGADFGTGFWTLLFYRKGGDRAKFADSLHNTMGPVWEANHVWLIFILVVCWTAYPVAFASIASTLSVPLLIAAVGIISRGVAYALRGQFAAAPKERLIDDRVFALASVLTPFALGAAIGGIASGRVPVGNAAGNLVTSWLNPTSLLIGVLSITTCSYLSAVYLAGDAWRRADTDMIHVLRKMSLRAGIVAGALAMFGLLVLHADARPIWHGLTNGFGACLLCLSIASGLVAVVLVWRNKFGLARMSAALAVAAIVAGWAVAQQPRLLPGLTVTQAAAGRSTLIAVIVSIALGAIVLVPSLALLFGLSLKGRFDSTSSVDIPAPKIANQTGNYTSILALFAVGSLVLGTLGTVFGSGWIQALGVLCLCLFAVLAFVLAATPVDSFEKKATTQKAP